MPRGSDQPTAEPFRSDEGDDVEAHGLSEGLSEDKKKEETEEETPDVEGHMFGTSPNPGAPNPGSPNG